jgi:hypothetical protein
MICQPLPGEGQEWATVVVFSWPVDGETPMMKARIISVVILVAMAAMVLAPLLRAFGK